MIAGYAPGASGQAAKQACRPYFVVTVTSCSRIASSSCAEQLARTGQQHVVDPHEPHEILAHALARGADARARVLDRRFHLAVGRIARMTERLREVEQSEAQVIDALHRRELARDVDPAPAIDL